MRREEEENKTSRLFRRICCLYFLQVVFHLQINIEKRLPLCFLRDREGLKYVDVCLNIKKFNEIS